MTVNLFCLMIISMEFLFFFLIGNIGFAGNSLPLGVYAGSKMVNETVAFELQANKNALVISDYFISDGSKNKTPKNTIKGTWLYNSPFLVITFGQFKDTFRKEDCPQPNPCFKFEGSEGKSLSPLNVPYGFGLRN